MLRRVMMIAGEASGDLHGAGVVRELKRQVPELEVFGVGGDRMRREGMELIEHISSLSIMGFAEVVKSLPLLRSVEARLDRLLCERRPDVLVLIDYPGFNLRFARKARRRGIRILYYVSPQVWAWNPGRVRKMKGLVDSMKVVFPFEVDIYRNEGVDVEFVGHPLVESLAATVDRNALYAEQGWDPSARLVALFPGSRRQEVTSILPVMADAAGRLHGSRLVQVAVGVAPNLGAAMLREILGSHSRVALVENRTHDLMAHADAAMVTSGTATLETGWFGTPMVVVYRTSPLTFLIGRMLVRVPYIGLVNIVAGKRVVPEFIQADMTAENLAGAVSRILDEPDYAASMRRELAVIREKLGAPGASARVARSIMRLGEAA